MPLERRQFLLNALSVGTAVGASSVLAASNPRPDLTADVESRTLKLFNTHTDERIETAFWEQGHWREDSLDELDIFLRDHREFRSHTMDRRLFEVLWQVQRHLGEGRQLEIISGYRTPKTNRMLRARSANVSKNSFHMYGRAIDFRVTGISTARVAEVAGEFHSGGVGYYPDDRFVHVDTGPHRRWTSS